MINRVNTLRQIVLSTAIGVSAIVASHTASAATFGVRVVDPQGQPVSGASVCIGLAGNYTQFGAEFTGADGVVSVEVPNVPLVVTVSKSRFAGTRVEEPARGFNLVKQITLVDGVPGPRCKAGSTMASAPNAPTIDIENVRINSDAGVVLTPKVTGQPSHYRISTDRNFESANWVPYSDSIRVSDAMADERSLFLQMRQYTGSSKGWLEARSQVVNITLVN